MDNLKVTQKVQYHYLDGIRHGHQRELIAICSEDTERWDQKKYFFTLFSSQGRSRMSNKIDIGGFSVSMQYDYSSSDFEFQYRSPYTSQGGEGSFYIQDSYTSHVAVELTKILIFMRDNSKEVQKYLIRKRPIFEVDILRYYEEVLKLKTHRLKTSKSVVRKDNIFIDYMIISYRKSKDYFSKLLFDFLGECTYDEENKTIIKKISKSEAWSSSFPDKEEKDEFFQWRAKFIMYLSENFDRHEGYKYQVLEID